MTVEHWLPVPDYGGLYEVSDHGRVRSWIPWKSVPLPHTLAAAPDSRGHLIVVLTRDKVPHTWPVHRLVMLAFVGPCPEGLETRHLDDVKLNNRLTNLCYGTRSENEHDKTRNGLNHNANKTHCPRGHPYDEENTYRQGNHRTCKQCERKRSRLYQRRLAATRRQA